MWTPVKAQVVTRMYEAATHIRNVGSEPLPVWIEPWAFEVVIPPGVTYRFVGRAEQSGHFEKIGGMRLSAVRVRPLLPVAAVLVERPLSAYVGAAAVREARQSAAE
jgi:hypothetical protein